MADKAPLWEKLVKQHGLKPDEYVKTLLDVLGYFG